MEVRWRFNITNDPPFTFTVIASSNVQLLQPAGPYNSGVFVLVGSRIESGGGGVSVTLKRSTDGREITLTTS